MMGNEEMLQPGPAALLVLKINIRTQHATCFCKHTLTISSVVIKDEAAPARSVSQSVSQSYRPSVFLPTHRSPVETL